MSRRVLLVGDIPTDRLALESLLQREGFHVVGEAASPASAGRVAGCLQPDFTIVALETGDEDSAQLLHAIAVACPGTRLVGIGRGTSRLRIEEAFGAGLVASLVEDRTTHDLVRALREVARGGLFLSPRASGALLERYR